MVATTMFDTSETEENAYEVEKVIRKNTWRRSMHGHVDWMYAWRGITGKGGYGAELSDLYGRGGRLDLILVMGERK